MKNSLLKNFCSLLVFLCIFLSSQAAVINSMTAQKIQGYWEDPTIGTIIHIEQDRNRQLFVSEYFDVTHQPALCVLDHENTENWDDFVPGMKKIEVNNNQLFLTAYSDEYPEVLNRLTQLPKSCQHPLATDDPHTNLNFLWQYYNEYYPDLTERLALNPLLPNNITWGALKKASEKRIYHNMREDELFSVLSEMLLQLQDGHVNIWYGNDREQSMNIMSDPALRADLKNFRYPLEKEYGVKFSNPLYDQKLAHSIRRLHHIIDTHYLTQVHHAFRRSELGNDPILTWGLLRRDPKVGYFRLLEELRIDSKTDLSDQEEINLFKRAIDRAMIFFKRAHIKKLIIDDRINFGCDDVVGFYLSQYLADHKRFAYQVKYRYKNQWTNAKKYFVQPRNVGALIDPKHPIPIILLTSSMTYSSGENLAAMLRVFPYVKIVGYPTYGIFAEMATRQLPNGWLFSIPMSKYVLADGKFYGGIGIPPDVVTENKDNFLLVQHLQHKQDIVLEHSYAIFKSF